jgi:tRNA(fMet)-specific endonuclease VapC
MIRYLLDTGIASDFINRRGLVPARARLVREEGNHVGLATPVLGELIAGIRQSNDAERHLSVMWRHLSHLSLWVFDKSAAIKFGDVYAQLRRVGRLMQISDIQIAAIALTLPRCVVVSKDSDFAAVVLR